MITLRSLACGLAFAGLATASHAGQISATTALSGANENPANSSPGTGSAIVTVDTTNHLLRVTVNFSGLTTNTVAAHIHCCTSAPNNTGVATTVPAFAGFPLGVTSGSLDQTYDMTSAGTWNAAFVTANGGTPAGAEAAFTGGLSTGQTYLNIHTSQFPGGEIRGFLVPQLAPIGPGNVPTLSEWGLVLLALLLAAATWLVFRRRMR